MNLGNGILKRAGHQHLQARCSTLLKQLEHCYTIRQMPWLSGLSDLVVVQRFWVRILAWVNWLLEKSVKAAAYGSCFLNQERIMQQKERDGLCFSYAVHQMQRISNPHYSYGHLATGNHYCFTLYNCILRYIYFFLPFT